MGYSAPKKKKTKGPGEKSRPNRFIVHRKLAKARIAHQEIKASL